MTTENSTPIDVTDDLDLFSEQLFNPTKASPVNEDAEDTSIEDDTLATEDETDTSEDADDNEAEDKPVEKPKGKKSASERISEINAKYREEERVRLAAEARATELERQLNELKAPKEDKPTPAPVQNTGPTADDLNEDGSDKYPLGEFDPKLAADRADFYVQQAWAARMAEEKEQAEVQARTQEVQQLANSWESKLQAIEESGVEDIRAKTNLLQSEFGSLPEEYGEYLARTLMSLDKGAEVANYLAENIEETREIVASGRTAATIALGRIEARFMAEDGNKVKPKVTKAPEPPKNLNRGSNGQFAIADDTDDLDAFIEKWNTYKKK